MPTYDYACECGQKFTRVMPMISCKKKVRCPACNTGAARDYAAEHGGFKHAPGNWPMKSDAAGVHPDQAAEAQAHAESIGIPTQFIKDGRAVFTDAGHRKKYCEAVGLYDRNGGYSDPQRQRRS